MEVRAYEREKPNVLSAGTLKGDAVVNMQGEDLGRVEEIMLDLQHGRVAYAVLATGGFLGMGEKFFAIPWEAMTLDADKHRFILNVDRSRLENAEGFDKNNWPDFANREWGTRIHQYYGREPYWNR